MSLLPLDSDLSAQDRDEDWQRVHFLSPFLRAGRLSYVAAIFVVQGGIDPRHPGLTALGLLALLLVLIGIGTLSWRAMRYRIADGQIEVRSGIINREVRRLPIARIEAVEVAQPALARIVSLAEVRIQAAATGENEIILRYLSDSIAWKVRDDLRTAKAATAAATVPADASVTPADSISDAADPLTPTDTELAQEGRDIFTVENGNLFWGYIAARALLPVAVLIVGLAIVIPVAGPAALGGAVPALIGIVSWIVAAFRAAETNYNFTLYEHPDGLFLHRGLLNKLTQRVKLDRVQSVAIQEPWLWRKFGRARVLVDIAGFRERDASDGAESAMLVPIAKRSECLAIIERVLPGFSFDDIDTSVAPKKAKILDPFGRRFLRLGENASSMLTSFGVFRRVTVVVPHHKVQSWRTTAGPIQRRLGLSTLHLDTAGNHIVFSARHRSPDEVDELVKASRQQSHSA